jgi:hypothetical protein
MGCGNCEYGSHTADTDGFLLSYVAPVLNSGKTCSGLNHYGGNMINLLTNGISSARAMRKPMA